MTDAVSPAEGAAHAAEERSACKLCGSETPPAAMRRVNGQPSCDACVRKLEVELQEQRTPAQRLPVAALGGLVGGVLGAIAWAAIVVLTNFEVGYVAVLVGYLAGRGVKLAAGKGRGKEVQALAAAAAVVGLVVAKYLIFAHYMREGAAADGVTGISWVDPRILAAFPGALGQMVGGFDLLWLFLAVSAAYRVPQAAVVHIEPR